MSSNGDGALQWIFGLYQYDTTWDNPQHTTAFGDPGLLAPADGSSANPRQLNGAIDGHLEGESYAAFGQIDWTFGEDVDVHARRALHRGQEERLGQGVVRGTHVPPRRSARRKRTLESAIRAQLLLSASPQTCRTRTLQALLSGPLRATAAGRSPRASRTSRKASALDVTQAATGCVGCVAESGRRTHAQSRGRLGRRQRYRRTAVAADRRYESLSAICARLQGRRLHRLRESWRPACTPSRST